MILFLPEMQLFLVYRYIYIYMLFSVQYLGVYMIWAVVIIVQGSINYHRLYL